MGTIEPPELPAFDYTPGSYQGPSRKDVLQWRHEYLSPSLFTYYESPLMLVEGRMQYVFDETGRRYLDAFGGIATINVGHGHPDVTAAIKAQVESLQHAPTIYLNPVIAEYARDLAARLPEPLNCCTFVNSGSEANDLAMLMARLHTGSFDFISLRNGYHGGSQSTMGLNAQSTWKYNLPHSFGIQHAMTPDTYSGPWGADDPDAGRKYADDVQNIIETGTSGRIAGFFAESIQGVAGSVVFPAGYLESVYASVRNAGGLCIADEVQSGFGRTGTHYWGFEEQGVVPDIVTMAKSIGDGVPLGAVVTTREIAASMTERFHFNTFGGNPVSCAAGRAVLEVIDRERLQANALAVGGSLKTGLETLKERHTLVGDIRGRGLMLGVELVDDRGTKKPAKEACARVFERSRERGLLTGKGGLHGNVLRITPPLCVTEADAEFIVQVLDAALTECAK